MTHFREDAVATGGGAQPTLASGRFQAGRLAADGATAELEAALGVLAKAPRAEDLVFVSITR